jgi:hypothetical protein
MSEPFGCPMMAEVQFKVGELIKPPGQDRLVIHDRAGGACRAEGARLSIGC